MKKILVIASLIVAVLVIKACTKPDPTWVPAQGFILESPAFFPPMDIPTDNPMSVEGVLLGRMLFFEKRLSGDNTQACADCHFAEFGFSDPDQFSVGIDGIAGNRQAMPIVNLGWADRFFWDGRANSLEEQALEPISNPIEMHEEWTNAIDKVMQDHEYRRLFAQVFHTNDIDSTHAAKAMAQFMRTMISSDSKFDRVRRGEAVFDTLELEGLDIFTTERGDCFHCHGQPLFTDNQFRNNGLDSFPTDSGFFLVTNFVNDIGKFKVPSLRNIEVTAPYMHDGRFQTLDEVIDFYSQGLKWSPYIDPLMKNVDDGGLNLTPDEKTALKAFLLTLTDETFLTNPAYSNPH